MSSMPEVVRTKHPLYSAESLACANDPLYPPPLPSRLQLLQPPKSVLAPCYGNKPRPLSRNPVSVVVLPVDIVMALFHLGRESNCRPPPRLMMNSSSVLY